MNRNGFTMMELMIVVVIIGIIATVAIPSYTHYIAKATRSAGTSILTQGSNRQEQFRIDNKTYASTMTQLGFSANPLLVTSDGSPTTTAANAAYSVAISAQTATTFTLTATAQGTQANRDAACTPLTLTHRSERTPPDCW